MRKFFTLALMAAAVGVASMGSLGCSSGDGSGGSGGGDGGSGGSGGDGGGTTTSGTTSGTSSGTTGSTTTSNTNTSADCTGLIENPNECGTCIIDQCCVELQACANDAECNGCLAGMGDPAACDANSQLTAVNDCGSALCSDVCGGGGGAEPACDAPATSPSMGSCVTVGGAIECNPITNEGCADPGSACDASQDGFVCFPDGNVQALCEECGVSGSDYCQPGMTCVGKCARYCCEDTDCGTGKCTKGSFAGSADVGFCEAL